MFQYLARKGIIKDETSIEVLDRKNYFVELAADKLLLRERENPSNKLGLEILTFANAPKGWILKESISEEEIQKFPDKTPVY
jgi:hypothetical protein